MQSAVNPQDAFLSKFILNLLLDTGFYTDIDKSYADKNFLGKGKECFFLEKACNDTS